MTRLTKTRHSGQPSKKEYYPQYRFYFEGFTEWHYFNGFKKGMRGVGVSLVMKKPVDGRSKSQLVYEAIKDAKYHGRESGDKIFVVFDIDAPYDAADLNRAIELARLNNIELVISNDSFELWPLLHFRDISMPMTRTKLEKELSDEMNRHFYKKYKKPCPNLFDILAGAPDLTTLAIQRAKKLPAGQNPSTDVYKLVELLRKLHK